MAVVAKLCAVVIYFLYVKSCVGQQFNIGNNGGSVPNTHAPGCLNQRKMAIINQMLNARNSVKQQPQQQCNNVQQQTRCQQQTPCQQPIPVMQQNQLPENVKQQIIELQRQPVANLQLVSTPEMNFNSMLNVNGQVSSQAPQGVHLSIIPSSIAVKNSSPQQQPQQQSEAKPQQVVPKNIVPALSAQVLSTSQQTPSEQTVINNPTPTFIAIPIMMPSCPQPQPVQSASAQATVEADHVVQPVARQAQVSNYPAQSLSQPIILQPQQFTLDQNQQPPMAYPAQYYIYGNSPQPHVEGIPYANYQPANNVNQPATPTYQVITNANQPVNPTYQVGTNANQPPNPTYQVFTNVNQSQNPAYQVATNVNQPGNPTYQIDNNANQQPITNYQFGDNANQPPNGLPNNLLSALGSKSSSMKSLLPLLMSMLQDKPCCRPNNCGCNNLSPSSEPVKNCGPAQVSGSTVRTIVRTNTAISEEDDSTEILRRRKSSRSKAKKPIESEEYEYFESEEEDEDEE